MQILQTKPTKRANNTVVNQAFKLLQFGTKQVLTSVSLLCWSNVNFIPLLLNVDTIGVLILHFFPSILFQCVIHFSFISFSEHCNGSTDSVFWLLFSNLWMVGLVQEEGWPLGLRFLNSRIGLMRNGSGSASFSTVLTASHTPSTDSSSDLDTESTGSLFHDNSITLGSLIGISSFLELSRRSTRGRMVETSRDNKRIHKLKPWLFSLCSRLSTDAVIGNDAPSLGHYLEAERRAANSHRRSQFPTTYGPNGFSPIQDSTSLLVGSQIDHWPSASLDPNREMEE
ncbi:hypothetical protein VNO78_15876 [Psophocarpus tetragonolobus]|uniref:Uncharacterized protein n=1 Tax=Psophocarpus tetragonolobus TaxID=3891 RepID=A0AAN9XJZ9_PSOTE